MNNSSQSKAETFAMHAATAWTEQDQDWLLNLYPALTAVGYKAAVELEMDLQRCEEKTELTATSDRAWKLFTAIRQRMTKAALEQMDRLAECALSGKSESDPARRPFARFCYRTSSSRWT